MAVGVGVGGGHGHQLMMVRRLPLSLPSDPHTVTVELMTSSYFGFLFRQKRLFFEEMALF